MNIQYQSDEYIVATDSIQRAKIIRTLDAAVTSFFPGADTEDLLRALDKCPSHDAKEALLASYF